MSKLFFYKLSTENQRKIEEMILQSPLKAVSEFQKSTGCSLSESKVWVDEKRSEIFHNSLPPCPYCGEKLRTHLAKQCRFCLRDWHDENNLKQLK